jgi:hypothetical protein
VTSCQDQIGSCEGLAAKQSDDVDGDDIVMTLVVLLCCCVLGSVGSHNLSRTLLVSFILSFIDRLCCAMQQVGHVQQLGSIPISLVQLSSAAAGDSGSSDGSPNLCSEGSPVALALGERPWLLRWPGNSGGELGGGTGSDSRYDSGGSSAGTPKGSLGGSLGGNRSLTDDRALVWPTAVPLSERRLLRAAGLILPGTDDVESSR